MSKATKNKSSNRKRGPTSYPDEYFYLAATDEMVEKNLYKFGTAGENDRPGNYIGDDRLPVRLCVTTKCSLGVKDMVRPLFELHLEHPDVVRLEFSTCKKIIEAACKSTTSAMNLLATMEINSALVEENGIDLDSDDLIEDVEIPGMWSIGDGEPPFDFE